MDTGRGPESAGGSAGVHEGWPGSSSSGEHGRAGRAGRIGEGGDRSRPSVARVHDYLVGGRHHRQVDREFADEIRIVVPGIDEVIRELAVFRPRVVAHLASLGIDQYVDLGCGLPTVAPTHEVAERAGVPARVVYVDNDPEVVADAGHLLRATPGTAVVAGDVADAGPWLTQAAAVLDLSRPVAVLASAVLQYADDTAALATVRAVRAATAPGSWLAVAALTGAGRPEPTAWARARHGGVSYPPRLREPADMDPWLDGYDVPAPGWVAAAHWEPGSAGGPDPEGARSGYWGVLARRR